MATTTTNSMGPDLTSSMMGYIFVTVSMILYALYEVQYKRLLSPDKFAAILSSSSSSSSNNNTSNDANNDENNNVKPTKAVQVQSPFVQVIVFVFEAEEISHCSILLGEVCDVGDWMVRYRSAVVVVARLLHR